MVGGLGGDDLWCVYWVVVIEEFYLYGVVDGC